MPRPITIHAYQFSELSDEAKEKARDWWRELEAQEPFDEYVITDAATIAELMGITLKQRSFKTVGGTTRYEPEINYSGWGCQGDGASFLGTYAHKPGAVKAVKDHAPTDEELHRIIKELTAEQKKHGYQLRAAVTNSDSRMSHEYSVSVSVTKGDDDADVDKDTEETVTELLRSFMRWIYKQLEAEHDYRMSDEQVDESIEANEYEFDISGKRLVVREEKETTK